MTDDKELTQEEMGERFDNPIMKNQITGDQFVENRRGEIRLKGDFVGETGYVSLEDVVKEVKSSGKGVVLNIGDSSTSGWDSDMVAVNREIKHRKGTSYDQEKDAIFPIFNYRTYSDCLRDVLGNRFIVVNAGVPTHTSLNGLRRIKELFRDFWRSGISIDYVTTYYGNNDSVCNGNVEEKYRKGLIGKVKRMLRSDDEIVTRTSIEDFRRNMRDIVRYCKKRKATPIIIEPATPLYWEPGRRVKRKIEFDEDDAAIRATISAVRGHYNQARHYWETANRIIAGDENPVGDFNRAIEFYEKAREMDYITPRIKSDHLQELREVSQTEGVSLVQIEVPRDKNDGKDGEGYFGDYCHPIERANKLYAEKIAGVVMHHFWDKQERGNSNIPDNIYTLY
jgi:hypothetical protein